MRKQFINKNYNKKLSQLDQQLINKNYKINHNAIKSAK